MTVAALRAQNPFSDEVKAVYQPVQANILKAAEKMPDSPEYGFKPTPDVRTFGQLIAHVADAQMGMCGIAKGEPRRGNAASKTTKPELIAALKASMSSVDGVYSTMTDDAGSAAVKNAVRRKAEDWSVELQHRATTTRSMAQSRCTSEAERDCSSFF